MKKARLLIVSLLSFIVVACGTSDPIESEVNEKEATTAKITSEKEIEDHSAEEYTQEETATGEEQSTSNEPLNKMKVHYIDVGQADATLLEYTDGEEDYHIIYDTGDWRGNEVVSYLNHEEIEFIDLIIISHPDADHIGQLDQVMQAFQVGEVWMSGNESSSQTFQRAIESVLNSDADYEEPRAGDSFDIGPLEIDVLHPNDITNKANEESIAILFTYGTMKFLFTGDAFKEDEKEMRQQFDVNADILQLGHHGSNTSSSSAFIDAVSPSLAIYSASENNNYGHPSPEVVQSVEERGIELYGTDIHGTIVITTDGNDYEVETEVNENIETVVNENKEEIENTVSKEPNNHLESCININQASIEELQNIIHIGPERAEKVVELQPFDSVDDLRKIHGIGSARIVDIKEEGTACVQ